MLTPRVVLGAVVLFAMVRFFATPTWPCAFVVAVALAVGVAAHVLLEARHSKAQEVIWQEIHQLRIKADATAEVMKAGSERIDRLERMRALGG